MVSCDGYGGLRAPATKSIVNGTHSIAERHSLRLGNWTKIGPLRGENPVRSGFVILSWRRWNSQFNKLRRDWFVADTGQERSGFAMRQQRNLSGNQGMFGIFVIPFQSIRR